MKKIFLNDTTIQIDQNSFLIQREGGFLALGSSNSFNGFQRVQTILTHGIAFENHSVFENEDEYQNYILRLLKEKDISEPAAFILNTADMSKIEMTTLSDVTAIVTAASLNKRNLSIDIILLINRNLNDESLLKLFIAGIETKLSVLYDLNVFNYSTTNIQQTSHDTLLLACKGSVDQKASDLTELQALVQECVREALTNLLKNWGYPQPIQDFIERAGVTIEDLVDAGMELCVGVEKSEELSLKLHDEILKALKDINVISLVMAGIRLEEDLGRHRVRGVNVDDDPAYLYSDEVLGMAIANQIAGTKAIFNFKRYDEDKPGIISTLGPVLDDVFAGLIAGCMSKMFEE